jgi:hypothetical protein
MIRIPPAAALRGRACAIAAVMACLCPGVSKGEQTLAVTELQSAPAQIVGPNYCTARKNGEATKCTRDEDGAPDTDHDRFARKLLGEGFFDSNAPGPVR